MENEVTLHAIVKPNHRARNYFIAFAVVLSVVSVVVELWLRQFESLLGRHVSIIWFAAYLLLSTSFMATERFIAQGDSRKALISLSIGIPICAAFVIGFAQYIAMSIVGIAVCGLGLCGLSPFINLALLYCQWLAVRRMLPDGEMRNWYRRAAEVALVMAVAAVSILWLYSPIWPVPGTGFGD